LTLYPIGLPAVLASFLFNGMGGTAGFTLLCFCTTNGVWSYNKTFSLSSRLRQNLLGYYFTNPPSFHCLRELAGILHADPANLSRGLRRLEQEGLFVSERGATRSASR
jgi:DNA-binding MarR family transcriptional regulator